MLLINSNNTKQLMCIYIYICAWAGPAWVPLFSSMVLSSIHRIIRYVSHVILMWCVRGHYVTGLLALTREYLIYAPPPRCSCEHVRTVAKASMQHGSWCTNALFRTTSEVHK